MDLTVGKLREIIKDLSEDTLVLGSGHFGEGIKIWEASIYIKKDVRVVDYGWQKDGPKVKEALMIERFNAGPQPD